MYPAQALFDGLYTVDDLPDTIVITYTEAQSPFTTFGPYVLTRTGSQFFGGPDNEVGIGLSTTGELWTIQDGSGGIGSFPCLINEESPGSPFVVTIEDQFADTYTVTYNFSSYGTGGTGTTIVSRQNLCCWQSPQLTANGREFKFIIRYFPPILESNGIMWSFVQGSCELTGGFTGEKTGNQNSPVGTYSSQTGFENLTVS
jgi:hypothetical protein